MSDVVTPTGLAKDLDVGATALRRWLRHLAQTLYPTVRDHRPWDRWQFSPDEAADLRRLFLEQRAAARTRSPRRSRVAVRFQGSEAGDLRLGELVSFISAIDELFEVGLEPGGPDVGPVVAHLVVGSPFDLQVVFPPESGGLVGLAGAAVILRYVVGIFNSILGGRADRAKTRAETKGLRDTAREARARTRAVNAQARKIESEIQAIDAEAARRDLVSSVPEARPFSNLYVEDRLGILESSTVQIPADLAQSERALQAQAKLTESRIEIDRITIEGAPPSGDR